MLDLIGSDLGPYRIQEKIGTGGMATVYKAYQPDANRYVALKVLLDPLGRETAVVRRFRAETDTAIRLVHPNIMRVYEAGEDRGLHYLVMDYAAGGNLAGKIRREGRLRADVALAILGQVAAALDYAHALGVVHRDVKLANILLTPEGQALLSDFGIAEAAMASRTSEQGVAGTPEYMSPEQAQGQPVDGRSDLYSLGIIAYEMLTGRLPFQAEAPAALLYKQVREAPPAPSLLNPAIPRAADQVILRALAKNRRRRYRTGAEMMQALALAMGAAQQGAARSPSSTGQRPLGQQAAAAVSPAPARPAAAGSRARPKTTPAASRMAPLGVAAGLAVVAMVVWRLLAARIPPAGGPFAVTPVQPSPRQPTTAKPEPSSTVASRPQATSTPLAQAVTASPRPTAIAPSTTPAPQVTLSQLAAAPVLVSPGEGESVSGATITLRWTWEGTLGDDEYFEVRLWRQGTAPQGITWTKGSTHQAGGLPAGQYLWSVVVLRHTGTLPDGSRQGEPISEESGRRHLGYWPQSSPADTPSTSATRTPIPPPTPPPTRPPVAP